MVKIKSATLFVLSVYLYGCGGSGAGSSTGGSSDDPGGAASGSPELAVTPEALDFGDVLVGTDSALELTVTNNGRAPVSVTRIAVAEAGAFAVTRAFEQVVIVPEASVMVEVTYTARQAARSTGSLLIESDSLSEPVTKVSLGGSGTHNALPRIKVRPFSIDFGEVLLGATRSEEVTIQNRGSDTLVVSSLGFDDAASTDLKLVPSLSTFSIVPRAEVTVEVRYTPSEVGVASGLLVIQSNDANSSIVTVPVEGTGIPVAEPEIDIRPTRLDFGEVALDGTSSLSIDIQNTGTAVLEISKVELDALSAPEFSVTSGSGSAQIAPGGVVQVAVGYTPFDMLADTGVLRITSNDADEGSLAVPLSGTGLEVQLPQMVVEPASLRFGEVLVGSSRTLELALSNSGSAPLEVADVRFGPPKNKEFELVTDAAPTTVDPGAVLVLNVRYSPRNLGADTGTLELETNDGTRPILTVSLMGTGISQSAPEIDVWPASLQFGEVLLGHQIALATEISNVGTDVLVVSAVDLGPETSAEFGLPAGSWSGTIQPGGSVIVDVTYTPSDLVADGGALRVHSDDADEEIVVVSLSGSGAPLPAPELAVSATSLDFGSVVVSDFQSLAVDLTNTGTAVLNILGVALESGTSADFSLSVSQTASSLGPGETTQVTVDYTPVDVGPDTGTLLVDTNDTSRPRVAISLSGEGLDAPGVPTLRWDAPLLNEDGTPVDDLAGYNVYRGSLPGVYSTVIDVGIARELSLENLPAGTYYLAVTAYDFAGNESVFSDEVTFTVPDTVK